MFIHGNCCWSKVFGQKFFFFFILSNLEMNYAMSANGRDNMPTGEHTILFFSSEIFPVKYCMPLLHYKPSFVIAYIGK